MVKKGKVVICDRCGEEIFLKCTGEKSIDGGYTRWDTFEPLPEGWGLDVHVFTKCVDLCPRCFASFVDIAEKYKDLVLEYMGERGKENE